MKKGILLTSIFAAGLTLLVGCGKDEAAGRTMEEYVSSFLLEDDDYVAFGATEINKILNKANYQMIPDVGASLSDMINGIDGLNTDAPIYFAVKGPMDVQGNPNRSILFIDITSADSMETYLTEAGYGFEDKDGVKIHSEDNLAIGIKNDLGVLIYSNEKIEGEKEIAEAFVNANRDEANPKVAEILNDDSDIIIGTNFEAIYRGSELFSSDDNAEEKAELAAAVEESYFQTVFKFEDGQAVIENRSKVNEKMAEMFFLKEEGTNGVAKNLGPGNARLAVAMNIDVNKIDAFLNKFAPEVKQDLFDQTGSSVSTVLSFMGSNTLSKLLSGEFGVALTSTDEGAQAFIPNVNAFVGIGEEGANLVNTMMPGPEMGIVPLGNGYSSYDGNYLKLDNNSVKVITNGEARAAAGEDLSAGLTLPATAKDFGNKPISAFFDLSTITTDEMEMAGDFEKLLNVVSFVYMEADNEVSRVVIQAKEGKENILQQVLTEYLEDVIKNIGSMPI